MKRLLRQAFFMAFENREQFFLSVTCSVSLPSRGSKGYHSSPVSGLLSGCRKRISNHSKESHVLDAYVPIALFLAVAAGVGIALMVLGKILGPKFPGREKLSPYECGFAAFEDAHVQFDVRYYLIAIMFIVFDLEIAFVFPWAVIFRDLGMLGLVEMGIFLGLLLLGFVYVWKKGALEWE
jgi:NADH-quinone oxidoreductase subunit A